MKLIQDIRFFKSTIPNEDGQPLPMRMDNPALSPVIHRIVMKLREQGFSLGDFDHLYINLTTCSTSAYDTAVIAKRSVDRYHPWYRYYDVQVSEALFAAAHEPRTVGVMTSLLERVLVEQFSTDEFDNPRIRACVDEACTRGADMLMLYKEKKTVTRTATIFLRYTDDGWYRPLLRVTDAEGQFLMETDLPVCREFHTLGDIQVSTKKVTVKPRKNAFSGELVPMIFEW